MLTLCWLATSTSLRAQTGPGGVGNQNGTGGQPRNVLWLDASTLSGLVNNDPVTSWPDQSGNGLNFSSLGTDATPVFRNDGLSGSAFVVRFDGTERYLKLDDDDQLDNDLSELTVVVVARHALLDNAPRGLLSKRVSSGPQESYSLFTHNGRRLNFDVRNTNGNRLSASTQLTANTAYIHTLKFDGTRQFAYLLSNSDGSRNVNGSGTVNNSTADLILGALNENYGTYFDGDIAEIIMFDQALTDTDRLIVENYLSQKYGIAITNDFFGNLPAYDASYFTDLRGIGSDGTNARTNSLASDALTLRESSGSLDANEFVMLAHSNTPHAGNITTERADPTNITDRWARDWYVEVNRGGEASGVDGGDVSVEMVFDFAVDPVLTYSGSANDYVLLYRSTATGNFDRVYADSYTQEGSDKLVVEVPASRLKTGYYTLGTGSPLLVKTWYAFQNGNWATPSTWTTDASTAPQLKNPSNEVPAPADEVIIRSGRTVTIQPGQNNKTLHSIKVNGNLNVTTTTGHNFGTINGNGTIRLAGHNSGSGLVDNFPGGVTIGNIGFADADNGGTVVIGAATDLTLDKGRTFRNLEINLVTSTPKVILGANMVLNGTMTITQGGFQFGDATANNRTLTVARDVSVAVAGRITTANTNQRHTFTLEGNFTNDGNVRFTNRANFASDTERRNSNNTYYTATANNGIVDVVFTNDNADQTANFRNTTYFYRIVIDKGVDATYKLLLKASNASNFRLLGVANDDVNSNGQTATQNTNAFALINGTAEVGGNVEIPVLSRTGNYGISSTARLWINGGEVIKHGGAIVPYGILEVSQGKLEVPGRNGVTLRANGLFKVSGGTVTTNQIRTSVQGAGSLGGYQQSDGTVVVDGLFGEGNNSNNNYYNFSLTYPGNVFIMSGGTLTVRNTQGPGAMFINSDPGNTEVTGGTVVVESSGTNLAAITSRAPFFNLTVSNSVNSTDANAKVAVSGGTSGSPGDDPRTISSAPDLVVLNDLTVETGTTRDDGPNTYGGYLDLCPDGTSCANLEVKRNLTINDSGVLDLFTDVTDNVGSATLTFNGTENGIFRVGNITTYTNTLTGYDDPGTSTNPYGSYRLPLFGMIIDKPGGTLQLQANGPVNDASGNDVISGSKNVRATKSRLLYVRDQFAIRSGATLNQIDPNNNGLGYSMRLYSNTLELDGNLFVYEQGINPTNAFVEFGGGNGTITINSTPTSSIGNIVIELLNDEIELTSDLYVKRFGYRHGGVNLGTHNLKIDVLDLNPENGNNDSERLRTINNNQNQEFIFGVNDNGANQFFYTTGAASDGGLSLKMPRQTNIDNGTNNVSADPNFNTIHYEYQNRNLLWFPIGVDGRYTPAIAYLHTNGTINGDEYITVRPVDKVLQTTDLSGGDILSYYWNVAFEGYDASEKPTVSWLFQYDNADTDAGTESNYVPGKVLEGGAYTRSNDGNADAVKDGGNGGKQGDIIGNDPRNIIIFNGSTVAATDNINGVNQKVFNTPPSGGNGQVNNNPTNTNWQNAFPGNGFVLENANYTAGVAARFVGAPEIYYSSTVDVGNNTNFNNGDKWNQSDRWSTVGHYSGVNAGTYPEEGDIAILGFGLQNSTATTDNGQRSHWYFIDEDVTVASLVFARSVENQNGIVVPRSSSFSPQLVVNNDAGLDVTLGTVEGQGTFNVEVGCSPCNANPASATAITANVSADFGLFASEELSRFDYDLLFTTNNTAVYLPTLFPEVYPNVNVKGQNNNRTLIFQEDITINRNLIIREQATLRLSDLAQGNITVRGDLRFNTNSRNDRLEFPNSGPGRTLRVDGDIIMQEDDRIEVLDNNNAADVTIHRLQVGGDIVKADGRIILYNGIGASRDHAILELIGDGSAEYTSTNNSNDRIIRMYQLQMNKETTADTTFTFQDNFRIADATSSFQPVEIISGTLVFNAQTINPHNTAVTDRRLLLANGSTFRLPNTANPNATSGSGGLEIRQGIARISGDDTGMILDGLLRISGGELDLNDAANNGNNFIEYSSSGQARIEVTDGTLTVGSQIRRGLNSTTGVLQYVQSGGTVLVGKNAAPTATRGVFEITNSGSAFEYTGGSLTIARDNNSITVPSLLLDPASSNVADKTIITIGNGDTPTNQDRFGIRSSINVARLDVVSPNIDASVYGLPLSVDSLSIISGATFNANGYNMTINKFLANDGAFTTSGNTTNNQHTYFPSTNASAISGSGTTTFWNFTKSGNSTLSLSKDVTVSNNAFIYAGTLNTQTSAFNLKKDLVHDAIHTSAATGPGIIFNGTQQQNLDRTGPGTSQVGVMELDNAAGLIIRDTEENFRINEKFTLATGVFDMGGNLLIFPENAFIENGSGGTGVNDFNKNNMIQTNSSIRDFGVRKYFNAVSGGNVSFTYPVGLIAYTPIVVTINDMSAGYITARPVRDVPPITEDDENTGSCADPNVTDANNVLQYYWIVKSNGISGFNGKLTMHYDANDVRVTSPYTVANYGPARLYNTDNTWDKVFTQNDFDESTQEIHYSFNGQSDARLEGIYTAGVTLDNAGLLLCGGAIPDVVPEFVTNGTGGGDFYTGSTYAGGVAPLPGETPDIVVKNGDQLRYNQNSVRTRKITIEAGAEVKIQSGTNNHNLGFVTGEGTLVLESNTGDNDALFPTGDYEEFFPDNNCVGGGGLEFTGTNSYAVLADIPSVRRLTFSGSGTRTLPNNFALKVCEYLNISNTVTVVIPDNNNVITVFGNVHKSDASSFVNGGGTLTMGGSSPQLLAGDFTGSNALGRLRINNAAGVTVVNPTLAIGGGISADQDVEVEDELVLTNGKVTTNANNYLRLLVGATSTGGSSASFVNGPLQAKLNDNDNLAFPVGKGNRFGQMSVMDATHPGQTLVWQAEYFNSNPQTDGRVSNFTSDDVSIVDISEDEYWIVSNNKETAPTGASSAVIGLRWDANSATPTDVGAFRAMAWNNPSDVWNNRGGSVHNPTTKSFQSSQYVSFSGSGMGSERVITLGSTEDFLTPVELISFTANAQEQTVQLVWETATEINNDYFEVRRSVDGINFKKIGEVAGNGNTVDVIRYEFVDQMPVSGISYYQLKQVDFDGAHEYSDKISVEWINAGFVAGFVEVNLYPNPAPQGQAKLKVTGLRPHSMVTFKLLDMFGKPYMQQVIETNQLGQEGYMIQPRTRLSAGVYVVSVQQGSEVHQKTLIVR